MQVSLLSVQKLLVWCPKVAAVLQGPVSAGRRGAGAASLSVNDQHTSLSVAHISLSDAHTVSTQIWPSQCILSANEHVVLPGLCSTCGYVPCLFYAVHVSMQYCLDFAVCVSMQYCLIFAVQVARLCISKVMVQHNTPVPHFVSRPAIVQSSVVLGWHMAQCWLICQLAWHNGTVLSSAKPCRVRHMSLAAGRCGITACGNAVVLHVVGLRYDGACCGLL
jgi:hypothetical protein